MLMQIKRGTKKWGSKDYPKTALKGVNLPYKKTSTARNTMKKNDGITKLIIKSFSNDKREFLSILKPLSIIENPSFCKKIIITE